MTVTRKSDPGETLIRLVGVASPLALTASFFAPAAMAAPGDLDPSFGNVGRLGPLQELDGAIWSLEARADDFLFGGGDYDGDFYYYDDTASSASGFATRMAGSGAIDLAFSEVNLKDTQVLDLAVMPDGRAVGVGRALIGHVWHLVVFRLLRNGTLDRSFGDGGIVRATTESIGSSVAIDKADRVIVAGTEGGIWRGNLVIRRYLPDGRGDPTFGVDGAFVRSLEEGTSRFPQLLRMTNGGLRVTIERSSSKRYPCSVLALTENGVVDNSYGEDGIADVAPPEFNYGNCNAFATDGQSRLLVAGHDAQRAFVERLNANGTRDSGFAANVLPTLAAEVTALGVDRSGSILVAGIPPQGVPGALVVRLQADGRLDTLFGNAGVTWIDMTSPTDGPVRALVFDMEVLGDGSVVVAGGSDPGASWPYYGRKQGAIVARLLGSGSRGGPGVIGLSRTRLEATESSQQMVATVRRMGGRAGPASVAYDAHQLGGSVGVATKGEDFTAVAGRIEWADGDATDKQIVVPIASNDASPEGPEAFELVLNDVQGGAALSTNLARAEIAGDPGLTGVLSIDQGALMVGEVGRFARLRLRRDFYTQGTASVTVTPTAGTAMANDVDLEPVTIFFPNGNSSAEVTFAIKDDDRKESNETFTVSLTNASSGAILGPQSSVTVTILDDDASQSSSGGGGRLDWLYALLGAAALFIRRRRSDSESTT